uniref:LysR family transcriptional regulator n=1 Tax=Actinoplanes rectilineatus TaxID=113571 RepID=UPI0005F2B092
MDPQLRHLRTLVTVVDTGTFTDAAATLGTSQAAVSRAIATLETDLGARLLNRTTRRLSPTPTGTQVLAIARRILDEITHLQRIVTDQREFTVGYAWSALGKHTRPVQRAWTARHPAIPLVFAQVNTPTAGLSEGTTDAAVLRRAIDDPRFTTTLIGTENRYAAVATDNALARRRTLTV